MLTKDILNLRGRCGVGDVEEDYVWRWDGQAIGFPPCAKNRFVKF